MINYTFVKGGTNLKWGDMMNLNRYYHLHDVAGKCSKKSKSPSSLKVSIPFCVTHRVGASNSLKADLQQRTSMRHFGKKLS